MYLLNLSNKQASPLAGIGHNMLTCWHQSQLQFFPPPPHQTNGTKKLDFAKARNCKLRGFSRLFKQFRSRSPTTNAVVPPRLNSTRLIGQGDETWCRYAMPVTLHHHYILRGLNTRCVVSLLCHFYQVIFILFVDFSEFCFCTYNGETSQWFFYHLLRTHAKRGIFNR